MSATPEAIPSGAKAGFVGNLQHRLARQFQVQSADWLDTCRELANWEDRYLVETPSPERLAEHAALLEELGKVGAWLESTAVQLGFDAASLLDQIRFALQDLRDSRAMWHQTTSPARKQKILRDCFNES